MEDNSKINSESSEDSIQETDNLVSSEIEDPKNSENDEEIGTIEPDKATEPDDTVNNSDDTVVGNIENSENIEDNEIGKTDEQDNFQEMSDADILNGDFNDFGDIEKLQQRIVNNMSSEFSNWEEEDSNDENSVLKKYIVYISKDFVPYLDNLSTNEMSAYINDAIQKKIDIEEENKSNSRKKRVATHIITAIITVILATPFLLVAAYKSIMVTFENYKYSQENFEKLYAQKFKKDRIYLRSLKYNQLHQDDRD